MMKLPPRMSTGPASVSDAVASALAFRGISDQVRAERVLTEWSDLVGSKIAQRTRPYGIVDRVLKVEVSTSAWLHELNLLRPQIFKKLTDALTERPGDQPLFTSLKFHLSGSHRCPPVALRTAGHSVPRQRTGRSPAFGEARDRIMREASAVDDIELRELISRVRIHHDC